MALAHAALPGMIARGRGGLLTTSSIAGFVPGTPSITYSASKAWATAFGEGLNELLRGTGVTSTVVAPGFVRSGFHRRIGADPSRLPAELWLDAADVARAGLEGIRRGRALVVPGTRWRALYAVGKLVPRATARAWFARLMRRDR
jgi:short-subunit dehydrogenase